MQCFFTQSYHKSALNLVLVKDEKIGIKPTTPVSQLATKLPTT